MTPSDAVKNVLLLEGIDETNIAQDSGGDTKDGITDSEFQIWLKNQGHDSRPVGTITQPEVDAIYTYEYWVPAFCPALPDQLDFVHFQWAVNHGIEGAAKTLQAVLGVTVDGIIGNETLTAVHAVPDILAACQVYLKLQCDWYKARVAEKPDQEIFLKGWINRTIRTMDIITGQKLSV